MSVYGASTILGLVRQVIKSWFGRCDTQSKYAPSLQAKTIVTRSLPHPKISVNQASTNVGLASWVIWSAIGCSQPWMRYWPPLLAKAIAIPSLPHHENERQRSVNDIWSCIFGNEGGAWLQTFMNKGTAALRGKYSRDISATASGTVTTYSIYRAPTKSFWPF